MKLSWARVIARRIDRHGLVEPVAPDELAGVAGAVGGIHAQVMSAAEISLALRLRDATAADVRSALVEDHTIIKTFGVRGTVHLLPASELGCWTAALNALPAQRPQFSAEVAISAKERDTIVEAVGEALAHEDLTLEELDAAVVDRVGDWAGEKVMPAFQTMWPRWRQAISDAGFRGALCYGPSTAKTTTYASPARLGADLTPPRGDPISWLLHRYLHAFGPATPEYFAKWLAATAGWAKEVFQDRARELAEVDVDGTTAWVSADDTDFSSATSRSIRLLPYFDAYSVGSHPRAEVFPGRASERALARGQAGNYPVLVISGRVAGVWHLRNSGKRAQVTVEPLKPLSARRTRTLEHEVERLGEIVERAPTLAIGPISVGPHA
jgi:hypothetical protein